MDSYRYWLSLMPFLSATDTLGECHTSQSVTNELLLSSHPHSAELSKTLQNSCKSLRHATASSEW